MTTKVEKVPCWMVTAGRAVGIYLFEVKESPSIPKVIPGFFIPAPPQAEKENGE